MTIAIAHKSVGNSATPTITATTAGNCLIVCVSAFYSGTPSSISGITLGGAADNFAQLIAPANAGNSAALMWADPNCAGGQTAVSISGSGLNVGAGLGGVVIYEVSGLPLTLGALLDKSSAGTSTSSGSWSSGTTAATTQASELWVGIVNAGGSAVVGPGAPWANDQPGGSAALAGTQVTTSTGTAVYSGTQNVSSYAALVATLKAVATPGGEPMNARGWIMSGFDVNTGMLGAEGISGP